jgi:hypothetical protein
MKIPLRFGKQFAEYYDDNGFELKKEFIEMHLEEFIEFCQTRFMEDY